MRFHQESTERQYALRGKAMELGWPETAIRTLDRDLGISGARADGREDFKTLVADVSLGQVGAVIALEASRLARSSLDWHRLIELCALTGTLVIDEDGCYDPADFNDALLLGLKGTLAQAELHFLRARLHGGKLNKARKGELRLPLPVGLCCDDENRIVLDPDQEVQGAVRQVFRLFEETGSAYGVMRRFARLGLRFPRRAYGGAWADKLVWGLLTHRRVLSILKNPSYAGAYVFGRYQSQSRVTATGEIQSRIRPKAMDAWQTCLKDHHEGYISWDEFLRNQAILERNQTNGEAALLSGPSREGLALLQGLLLCGCCGRRLTVRYRGNGGIYPVYECNWQRREGLASKSCMAIRCDLLDQAVAGQALAALQPASLELALEALGDMETRDRAALQQWQMRLERARYEAQLAERRYQEVDPANRLVASTLERRWNDALERLEELKRQYAEVEQREARAATPEQKAQVLALAQDFPRLWNAPTTPSKDRKRMLRLLIRDITVERPAGTRQALLHIRWLGGACADVAVPIPLPRPDQVRYSPEVVQQVRELVGEFTDAQIADRFNQAGIRSATGKAFTASRVQWIRFRYDIKRPPLLLPGEMTVKQAADRFGVSIGVVYYWIGRGHLTAHRLAPGKPYRVVPGPDQERSLTDWVRNSTRIQRPEHPKPPL